MEEGLILQDCGKIFEEGFNDLFLKTGMSLDVMKNYIIRNPYRLWVRYEHPNYFRRISEMSLSGYNCSLYGNIAIMEHPCIYPVVIHRKDLMNPKVMEYKWRIWDYAIGNGGVIAGAFISEAEKKVRDFAISKGGKIIYFQNKGFDEREKPSGRLFDYCTTGNLLIVSPKLNEIIGEKRSFRGECVFLNGLAERISSFKFE